MFSPSNSSTSPSRVNSSIPKSNGINPNGNGNSLSYYPEAYSATDPSPVDSLPSPTDPAMAETLTALKLKAARADAKPAAIITTTPTPSVKTMNGEKKHNFTLGTRESKLAMVQTEIVKKELEARWPGVEIRIFGMTTAGDKNQTQPLYLLGGKALWTKELEVALIEGVVDAIVHSLKDVPTSFPPGCELGAVLEREDPTDALVVKESLSYKTLDEIPDGSIIGTSSVRRVAQLRRSYPKLRFADVRGNLQTRLRKLDDPESSYTALILASAGLIRVGQSHRITAAVGSPDLYYAVGQGAIGVEIREGDARAKEVVGSLECWKTGWATRAERSMLRVLEGGCSVPVGCETLLAPGEPTKCPVLNGEEITDDMAAPHPMPALLGGPGITAFLNRNGLAKSSGGGSGGGGVNDSICPEPSRSSTPTPRGMVNGVWIGPRNHYQGTVTPDGVYKYPSTADPHKATLTLTGTITSLAGNSSVITKQSRFIRSIAEAERLGSDVAQDLIQKGGRQILEELGRHVKEVGGNEGEELPFEAGHPGGKILTHSTESRHHPYPGAINIPNVTNSHAHTLHVVGSKSPHGERTVFKEGEVCQRPMGW